MHCYVAHGLHIASAFSFHFFCPVDCNGREPDLVIRRGELGALPDRSQAIAAGENFCVTTAGTFLLTAGTCTTLVRNGREIIVEPADAVDARTLEPALMNVLADVLYQRGRFVAHASAATIRDGTALFMGAPGQGKSTLACALYDRGHPFVADDVVSLDLTGHAAAVYPECPVINLLPQALITLSRDPKSFKRVAPKHRKYIVPVTRDFSHAPSPLRTIYVLATGKNTTIETLSPRDAVFELVRHSYRATIDERSLCTTHLSQCVTLAQLVPVRRVCVDRSSTNVSEVARLVEKDASGDPL